MASLYWKVRAYLEANSKTKDEFTNNKVRLRNDSDGNGDYIEVWDVDGLIKPTDEQLNAFESEADAVEALNQVYANRKAEYPTIEELVVALYDDEDKAAIEAKRAEVKAKYPK